MNLQDLNNWKKWGANNEAGIVWAKLAKLEKQIANEVNASRVKNLNNIWEAIFQGSVESELSRDGEFNF